MHTPQQCLGPGCVLAARPHSKYCSEECGIQLAIRSSMLYDNLCMRVVLGELFHGALAHFNQQVLVWQMRIFGGCQGSYL